MEKDWGQYGKGMVYEVFHVTPSLSSISGIRNSLIVNCPRERVPVRKENTRSKISENRSWDRHSVTVVGRGVC